MYRYFCQRRTKFAPLVKKRIINSNRENCCRIVTRENLEYIKKAKNQLIYNTDIQSLFQLADANLISLPRRTRGQESGPHSDIVQMAFDIQYFIENILGLFNIGLWFL